MKKLQYLFAIVATLILASCKPEPISEDSVFLTEETIQQIISADGGRLYTINELLDTYMSEKGNYLSDTFLHLMYTCLVACSLSLLFSFFILLDKSEKAFVMAKILKKHSYEGNKEN